MGFSSLKSGDDALSQVDTAWESGRPMLGLVVGNTHHHWAWFRSNRLWRTWQTPGEHATAVWAFGQRTYPLRIVSVVPAATRHWQVHPLAQVVTLAHIPLQETYPSLGVDRALAVWGAGQRWGRPALVIDAGTGLSLTGMDAAGRLMGGAILPGWSLQHRMLHQQTGALPWVPLPDGLPDRWARDTTTAIQSGVFYTLVAGLVDFVTDWAERFPGPMVVTGGDGPRLWPHLCARLPGTLGVRLHLEPHHLLHSLGALEI
ncbi:MAG: pantothenate kinase [Gloeomargaritaceae cyanobacterium C42_A2020_066]|nr:pantothenate kinase [Gloeomargaritaceae cyanobacterium C42_A2020_066]